MIITSPDGSIIKIPAAGEFIDTPAAKEFIDNEFTGVKYIPVNGELERFGRSKIKILTNLHSKMSKSIRHAFKNTGQGYTFTSLVTLEQIEKREWIKVKQADREGNTALADKLQGGISGLYFGASNKAKLFKNLKTKLQLLKPGYKVMMYVKFEVMDE